MLTKIIIFTIVMILFYSRKFTKQMNNKANNKKLDTDKEFDTNITSSDSLHREMPGDFVANSTIDLQPTIIKKQPKQKKAKTQAAITPQTSANEPNTAPKEGNDIDFDLKKAVVYSEILHPKYKDYEN